VLVAEVLATIGHGDAVRHALIFGRAPFCAFAWHWIYTCAEFLAFDDEPLTHAHEVPPLFATPTIYLALL
jgi:hypothetical protein